MTGLQPLPDCEGPQLEPFARDINDLLDLDIELLDMQVGENGEDGPLDSVVWKVKIDGKLYAIKLFTAEQSTMFCRFSPHEDEINNRSADIQNLMTIHTTPFYNECRAYGRLRELGLEHLAIKVHGYIQLFAGEKLDNMGRAWYTKHENETRGCDPDPWALEKFIASLMVGRSPSEPERYRTPVMGIVKDWIDNPLNWLPDNNNLRASLKAEVDRLPRLLRDVHQLHKCGIVVRDLHADQYVNGVLVDFSRAWTIPHILGPEGGVWPSWAFPSMAAGDLFTFQTRVIDGWNDRIDHFHRTRNVQGSERLRKTRLRAYPKAPEEGAIARLRPRAHRTAIQMSGRRSRHLPPVEQRQEGPLFPLLLGEDRPDQPFVHWPPYDPSCFDWRHIDHNKAQQIQSRESKKSEAGSTSAQKTKKERSRTRL